ncbi:MAG: hypothetical protein CMJ18_04645 [Phycisphaeraceae bacterium]|nr:hypothetical protein [Phycisphaeraceae bacterium]
MAARPNILVFLTDDHGQWAANCYGAAEIRSPNLDRLAATGVRMTRAFTPSPVCSPARASFFTGRFPSQHGIHDWLDETGTASAPDLSGQTTIAELMQQGGYETALVGKWHCGGSRHRQPGFDHWFSYWADQYPHFGAQQFSAQGRRVTAYGHQATSFTDRVIEFLRGRDTGKPFFLLVGYVNTHSPWSGQPERLVAHYRDCSFSDVPREDAWSRHPGTVLPIPDDPADFRAQLSQYYAGVTMIDEQIGRIVDELESRGQLADTLTIYTADHGHMCGHQGLFGKGNATTPQNLFDDSILVPCMLSWPRRLPRGRVCDAMVDHCDLFATVLDAAGVTPEAEVLAQINSPGRSCLRMLAGETTAWRDSQCCEYGNARMIRTDQYKLVRRYPSAEARCDDELYDLQDDPRETVNRIHDGELAEILGTLSQRLDDFFLAYEIPDRSGKRIDEQPVCNNDMVWARRPDDIAKLRERLKRTWREK